MGRRLSLHGRASGRCRRRRRSSRRPSAYQRRAGSPSKRAPPASPLAQSAKQHPQPRPQAGLGAQGRGPEAPQQPRGEVAGTGGRGERQEQRGYHDRHPQAHGAVSHGGAHTPFPEQPGRVPGRQDREQREPDHREVGGGAGPDGGGVSDRGGIGRGLEKGDQSRPRKDRRGQGEAAAPVAPGGQAAAEVRERQPEQSPDERPREPRGEKQTNLLGRAAEDLFASLSVRVGGLFQFYRPVQQRLPGDKGEEPRQEAGQQPGRHPQAQVERDHLSVPSSGRERREGDARRGRTRAGSRSPLPPARPGARAALRWRREGRRAFPGGAAPATSPTAASRPERCVDRDDPFPQEPPSRGPRPGRIFAGERPVSWLPDPRSPYWPSRPALSRGTGPPTYPGSLPGHSGGTAPGPHPLPLPPSPPPPLPRSIAVAPARVNRRA